MTDYIAPIQKASEQYLTVLAKAQNDFVAAIATFVQQAPKAPALPAIPGVPAVELPSAQDITAVSFDFVEKFVAQNRTHTDKLIAVLEPAV